MSLPTELQSYVVIALEVLQAHDACSLNALKVFLTVPTYPNSVAQIMTTLVEQLLAEDPITLLWLASHYHGFQPEFCLETFAQQRALTYLEYRGYQSGHDFVSIKHQLYLTPLAQETLQFSCTRHEYQFLETLLDIRRGAFPKTL